MRKSIKVFGLLLPVGQTFWGKPAALHDGGPLWALEEFGPFWQGPAARKASAARIWGLGTAPCAVFCD